MNVICTAFRMNAISTYIVDAVLLSSQLSPSDRPNRQGGVANARDVSVTV